MKKHNLRNLILAVSAIVSLLFSACGNSKKLTYFNNMKKDSILMMQTHNYQTLITKDDILQISISTLDEITTRSLNAVAINNAGSATGTILGYHVDDAGMIKLPLLGPIKAEGFTKGQLENIITNQLLEKKIAKDPVVVVHISNYRITVLGEVSRPGNIPVPNEKVTILEALGQAGDLTQFGRRDSLMLIREENGKVVRKYFSLNNGDIFDPQIYNLRNKDAIYVSPAKERAESTDRTVQYASFGLSAVSLIVLVYVQLIR